MLNADSFHQLVSGKKKGISAAFIRAILGGVSVPYGWAVGRRNSRYDKGKSTVTHVDCPVICIGNLTLGGTGKTPMVRFVAHFLEQEGKRIVLVSRGYGSKNEGPNDEAMELAQLLPNVPHVQNRDRVAASLKAIEKHSAEIILLDDGFQHRRLARNLDIVLLDALAPFGFNRLFPRGLLREPIEGLARAGIVVLNRADLVSEEERAVIRQRVNEVAPNAVWCETTMQPTILIGNEISETDESETKVAAIETLHGKRIVAFCGLGNPEGFWRNTRPKRFATNCHAFFSRSS